MRRAGESKKFMMSEPESERSKQCWRTGFGASDRQASSMMQFHPESSTY